MKTYLPIVLLLFTTSLKAQQNKQSTDYLFPINPGQQNYLAGTMGEIRSSHFHTGIDIKTGGRVGLPIYAVEDGYVYRAKMSAGGYGNAMYLLHPNGHYSVYAHLQKFEPKLENWVTKQQYQKESFEVNLFPQKDQFAYKKGDIIGYSGNSGSSSGPHLHFEIRNANNEPMDVLTLGFDEIKDTRAPVVKKIAFVTLTEDARVNGFFGRKEFELSRQNGSFRPSIPIHLSGKIGIEIYSYDPMDGIPNKNGIAKTTLKVDDRVLFQEHKTSLSFSKQRTALVHYNYSANKKGSKRFNKLYVVDGNDQTFYPKKNNGIHFTDQSTIEIITSDSYGNTSTTQVDLSQEDHKTKPRLTSSIDRQDHFLHFKSRNPSSLKINKWKELAPYAKSGEDLYYVWNLQHGMPSLVTIDKDTIPSNLVGSIPSGQKIAYVQEEFELEAKQRSLFDTLYLAFEKEYDSANNLECFHFKNAIDPFRANMALTLKPEKEYHVDAAVYSVFGKRYGYQGGKWNGNSITFNTRDLVNFTILRDTVPPEVQPTTANPNKLSFKIEDNLSGIKSYNASIDGIFVLMYYDPKRKALWSKKLNENLPFSGKFLLEVTDNSNNITTYTTTL